MRERYRFNDDDDAIAVGTASSAFEHARLRERPSASSPGMTPSAGNGGEEHRRMSDWRFGNSGSSPSSTKRRRSTSPARPRSQQGSAQATIATAREADRDNASSSASGSALTAQKRGGMSDREFLYASADQTQGTDSLYKTPHLTMRQTEQGPGDFQASATGPRSTSDRPLKRSALHMSESESTSAASSSKVRVSHSRNSSTDDEPVIRPIHRIARAAGSDVEVTSLDETNDERNYVWRSGESAFGNPHARQFHAEQDEKHGNNPPLATFRHSQLPPVKTDVLSEPGPGSAPAQSTYARLGSSRSTSPQPVRLPAMQSLVSRSENEALRQQRTSSQRPQREFYERPESFRYGSLQEQQSQQRRQRSASFGMESVSEDNTRYIGQASAQRGHSPASHASQTVPGQAFIHPSLAGLPGSGGGSGSKQQPSFVSKLYSMLEDNTIEEMISWGPSGTTFSVANPAEFAKIVLPNWFKHSNWQSFVRQLNMYGFHKVNHTYQGTADDEIQIWEFKHPNFRRGEVHLLSEIKRKSSRHKRHDSMGRAMITPADFEYSGTPSPEMGIGHVGTRLHGAGPSSLPAATTSYGSGHHQQTQSGQAHSSHAMHHQHSRSLGGSSGGAYYREYPVASTAGPPGVPSAAPPGARMAVQSRSLPAAAAPAQGQYVNAEGITMRFDEVSERIDAIIRHATFYEGEMRALKEQIYSMQQNESSLRAHVHHLESQMRNLSDQLYQQQQQLQAQIHVHPSSQGQPSSRPPPPPPSHHQQQHLAISSPSERVRPLAPLPPTASATVAGGSSGLSDRSPSMAQPSFTSSSSRQHHPMSSLGRIAPNSSVEAYHRLPSRPSPNASSGSLRPPASPSAGSLRRGGDDL